MASSTKNKLAVVAGLSLVVVASGGTLYFKAKADAMQEASEIDHAQPLTMVDVYRVTPQQRPLRFEARGALEGIQEITVSAEVDGLAISKPVQQGRIVKPGELLCQIDPTFHKLALQEAEARLKGAEADLINAEAWLAKLRELEVSHKTELELKQRRADRDKALAARDLASAQAKQAEERLARCTIVSPIYGAISQTFYEEGELLTLMSPVAEIIDLSKMKLVVDLTDFEASRLDSQARITITSPTWPGDIFNGAIRSVYPKANPLTRRVPVEIWIDNEGRKLRSGSFVNCVIESATTTPKLLVPAKAVLHDFGTDYCYVAEPQGDEKRVRRRTISPLPLAGSVSVLEITAGLREGDLLIMNKHQEIVPEQAVVVRLVSPATGPVPVGSDDQ